jgi:hypothetical protein
VLVALLPVHYLSTSSLVTVLVFALKLLIDVFAHPLQDVPIA